MSPELINQIVGTGIAGIMLFILIAPMFKFLQDQVTKKDKQIEDLLANHFQNVQNHFERDNQIKENLIGAIDKLQKSIDTIPERTVQRASALYPPGAGMKVTKVELEPTNHQKP